MTNGGDLQGEDRVATGASGGVGLQRSVHAVESAVRAWPEFAEITAG